MSTSIFRIFNPAGRKEDRVQKRRAQLRQAQQNYRERKEKYTKSLEAEVARSRNAEMKMAREVQTLQRTVEALMICLHQNNILPPDISSPSSDGTGMLDEVLKFSSPTTPEWPLPWPVELQQHTEQVTPTTSSSHQARSPSEQSRPHESQPSRQPTTHAHQRDGLLMSDVNHVDAGMDFVLTLENPCLGHIHGDPDEPTEAGGHALTTSAQLLAINPTIQTPTPEALCRNVPAALLESLLGLSHQLCSDQEVTPVQAWNYIRWQPQFSGLAAKTLHQLAETLRDTVKCHGFGAVLQRGTFEDLVFKTLLAPPWL